VEEVLNQVAHIKTALAVDIIKVKLSCAIFAKNTIIQLNMLTVDIVPTLLGQTMVLVATKDRMATSWFSKKAIRDHQKTIYLSIS